MKLRVLSLDARDWRAIAILPTSNDCSVLMALWDHYVDYLIPDASPKTVNGSYNPVRAHIGQCKTDGLIDPLKFRQELLKVTTRSQARRTLMQLSAACK